ncbi:MAG: 16S rRNA (cytidine(1402)-2'-O)-methyltransferase [Bacillus thermozeamaize]|uniref:Ribosomal RNA small subunit methyltransferase I n=1 Tax=Bacillus thermozeamaize TaxID=230954 RepID=A0A1Y3PGL9_9BACI|nr:MAG: 16S rRNA (cytidine(1402)-2'-O)-methyltransferase [Bacillus thermozeamaize]
MKTQRSFEEGGRGRLYLVATPIGNLQDMTLRGLETLKTVDVIACEDTRRTRKLLSHFGIRTPFTSYHEHNQKKQGERILAWLREGKQVALVSDAGTPLLSDPGEALVREAIEEGFPVVSIPGANAALSALVVSGLPAKRFTFLGFLPRQEKALREELRRLRQAPETLILYEAPHRLARLLEMAIEELGDRPAVLARELTKRYEEIVRGSLSECRRWLEEAEVRGEFTVLIAGSGQGVEPEGTHGGEETPCWEEWDIPEHVEAYQRQGMARMEAIKRVARERGVPKREIYRLVHRQTK